MNGNAVGGKEVGSFGEDVQRMGKDGLLMGEMHGMYNLDCSGIFTFCAPRSMYSSTCENV